MLRSLLVCRAARRNDLRGHKWLANSNVKDDFHVLPSPRCRLGHRVVSIHATRTSIVFVSIRNSACFIVNSIVTLADPRVIHYWIFVGNVAG